MDPERRKRLLVIVSVLCIGAWAGDRLVLTPLLNLWRTRSSRIQELQQELSQHAGLLEREADLRARWEQMRKSALPVRVADAEARVLQSVTGWTSDSRLSVSSLKPRWVKAGKDAELLEIQLEGTGNMEAVVRFLYALEKDALPLRVEDLAIASQDERGERLNLTVRFTGLVLQEATS